MSLAREQNSAMKCWNIQPLSLNLLNASVAYLLSYFRRKYPGVLPSLSLSMWTRSLFFLDIYSCLTLFLPRQMIILTPTEKNSQSVRYSSIRNGNASNVNNGNNMVWAARALKDQSLRATLFRLASMDQTWPEASRCHGRKKRIWPS